MTYLEKLHKALIDNNKAALKHGDGKAWDNKKRKTRRLLSPRGNVAGRLDALERKSEYNKLLALLEEAQHAEKST